MKSSDFAGADATPESGCVVGTENPTRVKKQSERSEHSAIQHRRGMSASVRSMQVYPPPTRGRRQISTPSRLASGWSSVGVATSAPHSQVGNRTRLHGAIGYRSPEQFEGDHRVS